MEKKELYTTLEFSQMILPIVILSLLVTTWLVLRLFHVLLQTRQSRKQHRLAKHGLPFFSTTNAAQSPPLKTLVVLGSGGHTTEMLSMIEPLDPTFYHPIVFVKAQTDSTSLMRLGKAGFHTESNANGEKEPVVVFDIPRSREVGQSYVSSIFTTLYAISACVKFLLAQRPQLILCNGPGTCLPIALVGFFLGRILGLFPHTLVFVESFCRVQTLSLTGKLLYHGNLADLFVVHWPELQQKFPDSLLSNQFVAHDLPGEANKDAKAKKNM